MVYWGRKKGSLAKSSLAFFVDYRKNSSFQFNKHLLSTRYVKGSVICWENYKDDIAPPSRSLPSSRKDETHECDKCSKESVTCLEL